MASPTDPRQLDVVEVLNFFGANLPPRWVFTVGLILIVLIPLVAIIQAFALQRYGGSALWFILTLILAIVVLGIYVVAGTKVHHFLNKLYLRMQSEEKLSAL